MYSSDCISRFLKGRRKIISRVKKPQTRRKVKQRANQNSIEEYQRNCEVTYVTKFFETSINKSNGKTFGKEEAFFFFSFRFLSEEAQSKLRTTLEDAIPEAVTPLAKNKNLCDFYANSQHTHTASYKIFCVYQCRKISKRNNKSNVT